MRQRILVGLLAIPVILVPVWLGGVWIALLLAALAIAGALEFYRLIELGGFHPNRLLGLLWLVPLVLNGWRPQLFPLSLLLAAGMMITLVDALFHKEKPISSWMATAMPALYLGVMVGQSVALRMLPDGLWWLLFAFFVTWGNDTFAYFSGVTLGRHRLWPRISPKKTWEGTIIGWLGAAAVGAGVVAITPLSATHSVWFGMGLGLCCGVLALLGDLSISILKRQVGVKDSGRFFPGHGGMLDRMDSPLFVLPFVYQMVLLWARVVG